MRVKPLKVGIIGVGKLGAAYAFALRESRLVNDLVLIDLNFELALAQAADLSYGQRSSGMQIYADHWRVLADADLIVLAAGVRQRGEANLARMAVSNVAIFKAICAKLPLNDFSGMVLVASDPVDILTTAIFHFSGLPRERVLGLGTVAATDHLVQLLGGTLSVDPEAVSAFIVGAHDLFEFPLWSQTFIEGMSLKDFFEKKGGVPYQLDNFFRSVQEDAQRIVLGKGGIYYAAVSAMMRITRVVLGKENMPLTVTVPLEKEYGCSGISFAVPAQIGANGVEILKFHCSEKEYTAFSAAAAALKKFQVGSGLDL